MESNIILCGGPINYTNLPIGTNLSNAMIPINGKPVIGWILDDLLSKGINQVTVVLREEDVRLRRFLEQAYFARMDIATAPLLSDGSIIQSLDAGLHRTATDGLVRIILGDTLIRDSYHSDDNFVYTGEVEDSRRWCIVETNQESRIISYVDKKGSVGGSSNALAGYYHLLKGDHLRSCVTAAIENGERELSNVLRRYDAGYPIKALPVDEWYDFGHIDHLVDARRRLLQPRFFNSLTINPVLNTITKVSENNEKLLDELNWYLNIPDDLKVLTPRIVRHESKNGRLEVVQEYYGYPTLAELYVYGDLQPDNWLSILKHVLRIHAEFRRFTGELAPQATTDVYFNKTYDRMESLKADPQWESLLAKDELLFNDRRLRGIYALRDQLRTRADELAGTALGSVIHGDLCFSNILFDVNNQIIRLIDPRGSFGEKGVLGDARYDIAKLRHSVCGLYDFIVADAFQLEEVDGVFNTQILANGTPKALAPEFDRLVSEAGYDLNDIGLIEGLLFVSMVPLHRGHPKRQLMMYLTGLSLLNEVLEK
jgi:dTDP-glucose pyrophosphorylase